MTTQTAYPQDSAITCRRSLQCRWMKTHPLLKSVLGSNRGGKYSSNVSKVWLRCAPISLCTDTNLPSCHQPEKKIFGPKHQLEKRWYKLLFVSSMKTHVWLFYCFPREIRNQPEIWCGGPGCFWQRQWPICRRCSYQSYLEMLLRSTL